MKLQSRFRNDERFKLDERFIDSDSEDQEGMFRVYLLTYYMYLFVVAYVSNIMQIFLKLIHNVFI